MRQEFEQKRKQGRSRRLEETRPENDITERRESQELMCQMQEGLRTLLESIREAIIAVECDGRIAFANTTASRLFGYSHDELLGKFIEVLIPCDSSAVSVSREPDSGSHLQNRHFAAGRILSAFRKDGSELHIEITCNPIHVAGETLVVLSIADLNERQELEEQLQDATKMEALGRLAGGILHDINNLLTAISGYSQLALQDTLRDDPLHSDLEQIRTATNRAAELSHKLLAFSRKQAIRYEILNLNATVTSVANLLRHAIRSSVRLSTVLCPGTPLIRADPGQMEEVLTNLVINASDAMPEGGDLVIETSCINLRERCVDGPEQIDPGLYVVLSLTDTGTGMSENVQSHMFEPFFTTKEKGTGLGLSVVYGIVKQSGGHICVKSKLERGTTFRIYLPRFS